MTFGRLAKVGAVAVVPGTVGRLANVSASVPAPSGTKGRLVKVSATVPPSIEVLVVNQSNVEPLSTVTVSASATGATSWNFVADYSGLVLSGTGSSRTFTAPGVITGVTIGFTITATGGGLSGTNTCAVNILPHGEFSIIGGVPVAVHWAVA